MAEPIKMRVQLQGDVADVKVLMTHPMETGMRKDAKTGQLIPVHFIQEVTASLNGKPVLEIQWGQGISRNPYLGFRIRNAKAGDTVSIGWIDNTGDKNSIEALVAAG